jgi:hypothetical protein
MRNRKRWIPDALRSGMRCCVLSIAIGWPVADSVAAAPPTPTRLVTVFAQKERTLHEALARGDLTILDALVSREFEARAGEQPGRPIPRASWLQTSVAAQYPGRVEQMAVRTIGPAALVSFQWVLPGQGGRMMVIDLWDGDDDNAHLIARYATALAKGAALYSAPEATRPIRR